MRRTLCVCAMLLCSCAVDLVRSGSRGEDDAIVKIEDYYGDRLIEVSGPPKIPNQFRTKVYILSHNANKTQEYPPWRTVMDVFYDYTNGRARADVLEGFDVGRRFLRRYDQKREYMIEDVPNDKAVECKRSYLGETMPLPSFPKDLVYGGLVEIGAAESNAEKRLCAHWVAEMDGVSKIHVFTDAISGDPVRLTEDWIGHDAIDGSDRREYAIPLTTYDFRDFIAGEQEEASFNLPSPFAADPRRACKRHIGGFPYLHIFHWFVRF